MKRRHDVAAYVWPAYTGDEERTRMLWPEGLGEWQSVKNAVKKFEGHDWPRKPLWGYVNEADPHVMEMQIYVAAEHGMNVFLYDWYWYDRRPFLENCLNEGYLKARNNDRVKFYLVWAYHDVKNTWYIRISHEQSNTVWAGAVDRAEFERVAERLISWYSGHPSYYTIDGKPVFMIYDVGNLMRGLGGVEETREAMQWFRRRCADAWLPGLHLQLTTWGERPINLSRVDSGKTEMSAQITSRLGFDSMSHYQFVHFTDIDRDYHEIVDDVIGEWERIDAEYEIPYFPHVSIGWDNNPRFMESCRGIVRNNTPKEFEKALLRAREYVDAHPNQPPLVTVNSWNEWTEPSYLEPDDLYGYGCLEAVRRVFGGDHQTSEESR